VRRSRQALTPLVINFGQYLNTLKFGVLSKPASVIKVADTGPIDGIGKSACLPLKEPL